MSLVNINPISEKQIGDPYFQNVELLIRGDGVNASTSILDLSGTPKTITVNGTAQLSTRQTKFGNPSIYFDGSSNCNITTPTTTYMDFTKDFTVEFWVYILNVGSFPEFISVDGLAGSHFGHGIGINGTGKITAYLASGTGLTTSLTLTDTNNAANNTWYNIQFIKSGTNYKLCVNGSVVATTTGTPTVASPASRQFIVGQYWDGTERLNGYISNVRFTSGIGRATKLSTAPYPIFGYDPYAENVVLHLKGNGINNGTTFVDHSRHNSSYTISSFGNIKTSQTQSRFDRSSLAFDGTGDYLSIPNNSNFYLHGSVFTIEAWIYRNVTGATHYILNKRPPNTPDSGYIFAVNSSDKLTFVHVGLGNLNVTSTSSIPATTWTHVAAVCPAGGNVTLYINGIQEGTSTSSSFVANTTEPLIIGVDNTGSSGFNGYIDELRITKNIARYTSSFVPPRAPFPSRYLDEFYANTVLNIKMDGTDGSTTFTDSSFQNNSVSNANAVIDTGNFKKGSSSAYFNGSNSYLSVSPTIASRDTVSTIECWFYVEDAPVTSITPNSLGVWDLFGQGGSISNNDQLLRIEGKDADYPGSLSFLYYKAPNTGAGGAVAVVTNGIFQIRNWYHLAITFDGTRVRLFVNGKIEGETLYSGGWVNTGNNFNIGRQIVIGYEQFGSYFKGWIDNFRITQGVARYKGNFTPSRNMIDIYPEQKDPLWSQVRLFLNGEGTNASTTLYDLSPLNNTMTASGTAQLSTTRSKFGSSSMLFDASSNCKYSCPTPSSVDFRNDFTLEAWVYCTNVGSLPEIICVDGLAAVHAGHNFGIAGSTKWYFSARTGSHPDNGSISVISTTTAVNNKWVHLAATKNGDTYRFFVNGILEATTVSSSTPLAPASRSIIIGQYYNDTERFSGYLDDLRFTSACRYTTNFKPPVTPNPVPGARIQIQDKDPYWDKVVLHVPFTYYPTNNALFNDLSIYNRSVTRQTGTVINFPADSIIGTSSGSFNGSSNLTVPTSSDLNFGANDFTIECWIKPTSVTGSGQFRGIVGKRISGGNQNAWALSLNSSNQGLLFTYSTDGSTSQFKGFDFTFAPNTWYHIAICRFGNNLYGFVNGSIIVNSMSGTIFASTSPLTIGSSNSTPTEFFSGYIDELRLTNGVARYTSDFTPTTKIFPVG